jgi:hypothetical protein
MHQTVWNWFALGLFVRDSREFYKRKEEREDRKKNQER